MTAKEFTIWLEGYLQASPDGTFKKDVLAKLQTVIDLPELDKRTLLTDSPIKHSSEPFIKPIHKIQG